MAAKEEAIAAAKAKEEAERQAKLEEERQAKLAADREEKRLAQEREERNKAKAARAESKKRRASKSNSIPEPEEAADEAIDSEEAYDQAMRDAHLIKDEKTRNSLTWTLLSIGAVSAIVAIIEHRNTMAAKFVWEQFVTYNPPIPGTPNDFMAQAYDKVKKDHEMNRNIAGALSVITLGTSFVIYKF